MGKKKNSSGGGSTKVRFDGVDVAAMVSHLTRTLLGRRIINIYDAITESGNDGYLIKLDGSSQDKHNDQDGSGNGGGRTMLFIESGIRFHTTTQQLQVEGKMPTPFCMKLRKHLRGLRLERIVQLGMYDRVVDFVFGSGSNRHSLLVELYARGNILLCNSTYEIQALLRSHEYGSNNTSVGNQQQKDQDPNDATNNSSSGSSVQVKVGNVYPVTYATSLGSSSSAVVTESSSPTMEDVNDTNESSSSSSGILTMSGSEAIEWANQQLLPPPTTSSTATAAATNGNKGGKTKKKKKDDDGRAIPLKALLLKPTSGVYHYGPSLIEHCILCANMDPNMKLSCTMVNNSEKENNNKDNDKDQKAKTTLNDSEWTRLIQSLQVEGSKILQQLATEETGGYILYRPKDDDDVTNNNMGMKHSNKILEEFQPHLLKQHTDRKHIQYDTFADAVDDFFFHIGGQKRAIRAEAAEAAALEKLNKVKADQERRVQSLVMEQDKLKEDAQLVEIHAEDVDKALSVINSALDSGMDWDALDQLVQVEQQNDNPIALLIKRLDLENDAMVLSLSDIVNHSTDKDGNIKKINVTISLQESAYGNARDMFAKYRAYKEKSQKTLEASTMALKAAEATAQRQLLEAQKRTKATATIQHRRKAHWWEKFHWFITSDNYLVLGGRDAQQNEMLVKRYLRPGDAYLHADVHGAASCILRAKRQRRTPGDGGVGGSSSKKTTTTTTQVLPLSDQALREAGNFTICLSSAWTSRMVTSAWWVEPHQVSKTAPTGEYLTVGSFMVRGKKNFLPPSQLEMGLAVLFRLGDEDSMARHKNERRDFALLEHDEYDDHDDGGGDDDDPVVNDIGNNMEQMSIRSTNDQKKSITTATDDNDEIQEEDQKITGIQEEESKSSYQEEIDNSDEEEETNASQNEQPEHDIPQTEKNQQHSMTKEEINSPAETSEASSEKKTTVKPPAPKKKGLSARDRKLIKKYGSLEAAEEAARQREKEEAERAATKQQQSEKETAAPTNTKERQVEVKRGKKSKMKRAARKYDDQDDEDKELALMALHGGEKKGKRKKGKQKNAVTSDTQKKASAEAAALLLKDPSKVIEKLPEAVQKALAACVATKAPGDSTEETIRWDKFDADVLEQVVALETEPRQLAAANRLLTLKQSTRVDNFSASLAGIVRTIQKYGHENLEIDTTGEGAKRKTKAEKEKEKEAWKEALAEEGIADEGGEDGENAVDDTAELSKLTGKPHPDDVLQYAVPVCAPYYTLLKYKYKVKLTPGNQKRGKAAKQCLDIFLKSDADKSSSGNRDRDLIKHVVDNDWVQAICANVKISAAGASKAAKKHKASNKKKSSKKK